MSAERTLRFRSSSEALGFTILPNVVLLSPQLSAEAKILYALLRHYARRDEACYPGQERLARELPAGARSLSRYLQELQTAHLVTVQRRGQGKTNLYWIEPLTDPTAGALLPREKGEDDLWDAFSEDGAYGSRAPPDSG